MTKQIPPYNRIWELDFIRGLCVLLMIADHALFDLGFVFLDQWFPQGGNGLLFALCDFARDFYWFHPLRSIIQPLVVMCFMLISGISCGFSRSNLKRGLKLLGVALLLTAATYAMDRILGYTDYFIIRFGILHLLAISILLYGWLRRYGRWPSLLLGLLLAAAGLWFGAHPVAAEGLLPFILGIGSGSYSADYFPLLPWAGFFLLGGGLTTMLYRERRSYFPTRVQRRSARLTLFVGRHALWVYILHQPVIYGCLLLLGLLAT